MGRYADNLKAKQAEEKLNDLLEKETDNDKIESLKEVLNLLSQVDDGNTKLASVIDARITAALGSEGAITSAISSAITAGIGEGGAIETWGDGRYTKKTE
jgi:hypothetical protein